MEGGPWYKDWLNIIVMQCIRKQKLSIQLYCTSQDVIKHTGTYTIVPVRVGSAVEYEQQIT